jgi:DNA-binding MarR family transcriptional regulator
LDPEERQFFESLVQRAAAVQRQVDYDLVKETRTTLSEYTTMRRLAEVPGGGTRMNELAAATGVSVSRISRIVEKLAHDGLVDREKPAGDRRGWNAALSAAGRVRLRQGDQCFAESVRRNFLDHLTLPQHRVLLSLLDRLPPPAGRSSTPDSGEAQGGSHFVVDGGGESAW